MRVAVGFSDAERPRVAALYWEAFGAKLGLALGPRDRALAFLTRALRPAHAICARDGSGTLLGVAGFKTIEGALVDGTAQDMAAVYGRLGALWRIGLLALLERETTEHRFLMDGIAVTEPARGMGVGTALLEAAAREARARGCAEIRLDVVHGNDRARALYERRGFVAVGEQRIGLLRFAFGFRGATIMVRRLV